MFRELSAIFIRFGIVVYKLFQIGTVENLLFGKELSYSGHSYAPFSMKINYMDRTCGTLLISFYLFFYYFNFFAVFGTTPEPIVEQSNDFKIATIALAILSGLLIFLVVALGIAICRMRPRDY